MTVDTEFSIGGAFADAAKYQPIAQQSVLCHDGRKSQGMDFLLGTLKEFALPATFFVEPLNVNFFGDAPMGNVAQGIANGGHDIQLHLHPCWTYFKHHNWKEHLKIERPTDHLTGRSIGQLTDWIGEGLRTFERWGFQPTALRTGSMMVDMNVYRAMEACGLLVSSNVALGVFRPEEPELQLYSGLHQVGKVLEACVLSYVDREIGERRHMRSLTIAGASWSETRSLLEGAHAAGVESVVILTHPFEFSKHDFPTFTNGRRNRTTQRRLRKLCHFLAEQRNRFEICTFSSLSPSQAPKAAPANTLLKVPLPTVALRMLENAFNHHIRSF